MIFCSNCGNANEETANFCPNCGNALHKHKENSVAKNEPLAHSTLRDDDLTPAYDDQPAISGGLKALFYIITIFFSLAGIIIGIIYLNDPMEEKRGFGKRLLIFSIIWTVLVFVGSIIIGILAFIPFGHYMYY